MAITFLLGLPFCIPEVLVGRVFVFIDFQETSFFHLFTCAYICLGHFSPLPPTPTSHPHLPHFKAETVLPLLLILLKRRHKQNKKHKAFLLVELRIDIQRDS
jgi:hypothetical protein